MVVLKSDGHLPADLARRLPELLEDLADGMHNVAKSMVFCTCVAYLCCHHRDEIESAILGNIGEELGDAIGKGIAALIEHAQLGDMDMSVPVFDAHMREFMFTVRAMTERYIKEHDLEVTTEIP